MPKGYFTELIPRTVGCNVNCILSCANQYFHKQFSKRAPVMLFAWLLVFYFNISVLAYPQVHQLSLFLQRTFIFSHELTLLSFVMVWVSQILR